MELRGITPITQRSILPDWLARWSSMARLTPNSTLIWELLWFKIVRHCFSRSFIVSVLINAGFHTEYFKLVQYGMFSGLRLHFGMALTTIQEMSTNVTLQTQYSDNTMINGKMPFNCSTAAPGSVCTPNAPYSKFRVRSGKTYKLRLVNSGAGGIMYFSIDNHHLTIIANDFVDLVPYNTTIVTLGVSFFDVIYTIYFY